MYNYEASVAWIVYNDEPTIQQVDEMASMATVCMLADQTGKASQEVAADVVMRRIINMLAENSGRVRPDVIKLTPAQRDFLYSTENCRRGEDEQADLLPLPVLLRCELRKGSGRHVSVTKYLKARIGSLKGASITDGERILLDRLSEAIYYLENPGGMPPAAV